MDHCQHLPRPGDMRRTRLSGESPRQRHDFGSEVWTLPPLVMLDECVDYMASYQAKDGVCGLFRLFGARVDNDGDDRRVQPLRRCVLPFLHIPWLTLWVRRPQILHSGNRNWRSPKVQARLRAFKSSFPSPSESFPLLQKKQCSRNGYVSETRSSATLEPSLSVPQFGTSRLTAGSARNRRGSSTTCCIRRCVLCRHRRPMICAWEAWDDDWVAHVPPLFEWNCDLGSEWEDCYERFDGELSFVMESFCWCLLVW